jgi:hypothetical protein
MRTLTDPAGVSDLAAATWVERPSDIALKSATAEERTE